MCLKRISTFCPALHPCEPYAIHLYNPTLITVLPYGRLVESNWKINCKNSNYHAGRVINGSSCDIRSVNVLDNLRWKNLETRDTCKGYPDVQNQSASHLKASFAKLNDNNINYNLSNLETDLALPRPKTNILKRSFKYCAMLWNNLSYEARTAHRCPNLKANLPLYLLLDRSDAIICMCVYFKLCNFSSKLPPT